jgi:hypothetical protein
MGMIYCGELIDDNRMRVIISNDQQQELATLYFERAKLKFTNKPVGMNSWACVDAKTEGLYDYDPATTPKEIVKNCQDLIREFPTGGVITIPQKENLTDNE